MRGNQLGAGGRRNQAGQFPTNGASQSFFWAAGATAGPLVGEIGEGGRNVNRVSTGQMVGSGLMPPSSIPTGATRPNCGCTAPAKRFLTIHWGFKWERWWGNR